MIGFSLATACRAAAFSAAAYQTPAQSGLRESIGGSIVTFFDGRDASSAALPTLESRCSCFGIDDRSCRRYAFIDNAQTGTQVEAWTGAGGSVVSFRGTEISDPRDIATDIFVTQDQLECADIGMPCMLGSSQVHSGFGRAYGSVRVAVREVLQRMRVISMADAGVQPGDAPQLLLTGHSLGGALALLAARELGAALGGKLDLYTFGSPRVGDTALAAEILRATARCSGPWRVVNNDDYLVPRFPRGTPANRLWDYVHVGATVLLPPPHNPTVPPALLVAAIGDAPGCPLREVNPRYSGFLPPPIFDWPGTQLLAFAAQEARVVVRLLTRGGVSAHFMVAYDAELSRCRAAGDQLQLKTAGEAERVDSSAPDGGYLDLLRATWGETNDSTQD